MMSFIIDLFPQVAGSPLVAPPPRALFGDFSPLLLLLRLPPFSTGLRGSALVYQIQILDWPALSPLVVVILSFFLHVLPLMLSTGSSLGGCGSCKFFFAFSF